MPSSTIIDSPNSASSTTIPVRSDGLALAKSLYLASATSVGASRTSACAAFPSGPTAAQLRAPRERVVVPLDARLSLSYATLSTTSLPRGASTFDRER